MSDNHENGHHIVPLSTYVAVLASLFFLTALTIGTANIDFGSLNVPIALLIAAIKATIVFLWFMHLLYDGLANRVVLISAFVFLAILFFYTGLDIFTR